jgi:hypothetical protein
MVHCPGRRAHSSYWVGSKAGLEMVAKRRKPCPYQELFTFIPQANLSN